jgi:phage-related protein
MRRQRVNNRDEPALPEPEATPDKPLLVLHGVIKTPPMSATLRVAAGFALRRLQKGEMLSMPESRPMPGIASNCHELRLSDAANGIDWRIVYLVDEAAILVLDIFKKDARTTPESVKSACRDRIRRYFSARRGE